MEKAQGPEHPNVAVSLNNLAGLYYKRGHHAQTEPLFQRALTILEKSLGPEHPQVATGLNNLARLYYTQDKYAGAEPLYKRVLGIYEKALGPEHPNVAQGLRTTRSSCGRQTGRLRPPGWRPAPSDLPGDFRTS